MLHGSCYREKFFPVLRSGNLGEYSTRNPPFPYWTPRARFVPECHRHQRVEAFMSSPPFSEPHMGATVRPVGRVNARWILRSFLFLFVLLAATTYGFFRRDLK